MSEHDEHQGYCWPTLGEACGNCHRCTDPVETERDEA